MIVWQWNMSSKGQNCNTTTEGFKCSLNAPMPASLTFYASPFLSLLAAAYNSVSPSSFPTHTHQDIRTRSVWPYGSGHSRNFCRRWPYLLPDVLIRTVAQFYAGSVQFDWIIWTTTGSSPTTVGSISWSRCRTIGLMAVSCGSWIKLG